jgi:uncharacterized protein involved in exopolysaccharide biosynthesis
MSPQSIETGLDVGPDRLRNAHSGDSQVSDAQGEEYVDLAQYLALIFRNYWFILAGVLLGGAVSAAVVFLLPKQYTAQVSLLPPQDGQEISPMLSQFQGLASSMGLGGKLGGKDPMQFYEEILRSRTFTRLISAVDVRPMGDGSNTVFDGFGVPPLDSVHRLEVFHSRLLKALEVKSSDNGAMIISLTTPYPEFSAQLLNRIIQEFEGFLRENQVSKAKENLKFVETRLGEVKDSLGEWESRLRDFKDRNQEISNSPGLQLKLRELMREVTIHEEVFTLLKKEYEMAKIQDQREKPLIQILDRAETPLEHSFPQEKKIILACAFLGGFVFTGLVIVFNALSKYSRFFGLFLAKPQAGTGAGT